MIMTAIETTPSARSRHQICSKTVMDTTDPNITFDEHGVCNYWHEFQTFKAKLPTPEEQEQQLATTVECIKAAGHGRPYDCVLGLSGGVDSSYLAYLAKELGLRPLVVHFDNGWNSELAVANIQQLVTRLQYDLETFVMDWEEFRDLQRAYFKASVIDLEVPTDHMIYGALNRIAARRGIKFILSGTNISTEWLLPRAWYYPKHDLANLKGIHRTYGTRPLKQLPGIGVWQRAFYHARGIRTVAPLDLIDYRKAEAKQLLMEELAWRDYGGKHYESTFTRFYQGCILPLKFDVDKRKAHLSTLILTGQMTRDEALRELQQPTYDEFLQREDKLYIAKKLQFSADEFDQILAQPNRDHEEFGTDRQDRERYQNLVGFYRKLRNRRGRVA